MGLFSFLSRPQIPPISSEDAVVTWFLLYDDKIKDVRKKFPELFDKLKDDILSDLNKYTDGKALQEHIRRISDFYETEVLHKIGQMYGKDSKGISPDLLIAEASIAAKMRILGYFLLKKYNIQPDLNSKTYSIEDEKIDNFVQPDTQRELIKMKNTRWYRIFVFSYWLIATVAAIFPAMIEFFKTKSFAFGKIIGFIADIVINFAVFYALFFIIQKAIVKKEFFIKHKRNLKKIAVLLYIISFPLILSLGISAFIPIIDWLLVLGFIYIVYWLYRNRLKYGTRIPPLLLLLIIGFGLFTVIYFFSIKPLQLRKACFKEFGINPTVYNYCVDGNYNFITKTLNF